MMTSILISGILGLAWGVVVNLFNDFWTRKAFHNPKGKMAVMFFSLRQVINLLAMFLVYKNTALLIGTALGLLVTKNYIFIKNLKQIKIQKRKG